MKRIAFLFVFLLILSYQSSVFSQDKKESVTVTIEDTIVPEMNVIDNKLYLKNAPVGKRVEIISIIGNKVKDIEIKSSDQETELNLPRAIYIFKLDGIVKKFIIK